MWSLEQSIAAWSSRRWQARVDMAHPAHGMHGAAFSGEALVGAHFLQFAVCSRTAAAPQGVKDAYVRGCDLIVMYADTPQSPVTPQICWRVLDQPHESDGIVMEAIVSLQTPRLDSEPRMQLATTVPTCQWYRLEGGSTERRFQPLAGEAHADQHLDIGPCGAALLARVPAWSCSYGHIVPGADLRDAHLSWDAGRCASTLSLLHFGERLEKGVLRRVRSRALVAPRTSDEWLAEKILASSTTASPPLTT
jgi:hypothetical protein